MAKKLPDYAELEAKVLEYQETGSDESFEFIAREFKGFIKWVSEYAYFIHGHSPDDVKQMALMALVKAMKNYIPGKSNPSIYGRLCINSAIITQIKQSRTGRGKLWLAFRPLQIRRDNVIECEDRDESFEANLEDSQAETAETIALRREQFEQDKKELMELLTPMEKKVLEVYLLDLNYIDMAKRLGLKGRRGYKLCDNALTRIRAKADKLTKDKEEAEKLREAA